MRAPDTFSCTTALTRSSFFCTRPNSGLALESSSHTTSSSIGKAITSTRPKFTFIDKAMTMPPIKVRGARTNIRSAIETRSCTAVMSLVSRVTSEPVVKRSVCSWERCITRLKTSRRRSLPKFCAATVPKAAPPTPHRPPSTVKASITNPTDNIRGISPARTPLSTISDISLGCCRSKITSPAMTMGESRAKNQ